MSAPAVSETPIKYISPGDQVVYDGTVYTVQRVEHAKEWDDDHGYTEFVTLTLEDADYGRLEVCHAWNTKIDVVL
jgi:hypothetical protein